MAGDAQRLRPGEARLSDEMEGDGRGDAPAGPEAATVGECRIAGLLTRLDGRQCFTLSEPLWESPLLLLGEPGDETITCGIPKNKTSSF